MSVSRVYFFICFALLFCMNSFADDNSDKEAFAFYVENDSRNIGGPGSDQAYTNGLKLAYIYSEGHVPQWSLATIDWFHFLDNNAKWAKINYAMSLGHQIYTPKDTQSSELVIHDRPYASWLYLGFAVSLKEANKEHFLEVDLGTIGPSALGRQMQNGFHRLIGSETAKGWKYSLRDEPTVQIFYQKRYKTIFSHHFDLMPYYGAGLGNVYMGGHIGGMFRWAARLPDDFGASRPSAGDGNSFITTNPSTVGTKFNYYLFIGTRGNYVHTNIFLDGNTYQESHSIRKHPFTFETELGFGLHFKVGDVVWRYVTKSPEIIDNHNFNSFASVSFVCLI